MAAQTGKPPWSTKAFVRRVREIEHHDVVSSGILADKVCDKQPKESTTWALNTLEEAQKVYIVEVLAKSCCYKWQLISCRFSTCLLLWQGSEVGYSWNSPTCAWYWIWPKWPKVGFRALQWRECRIWSRNPAPKSEKRRCGVLSFKGIKRWRLW